MLAFISPLDGDYISLKRVALLIARERPGIDAADLMDMFKHAIFSREFERKETTVPSINRDDNRNYPLLLIEAPPPKIGFARRLPPDARPREYLASTALTVAEVLGERDALPGAAEDWAEFTTSPRGERVVDKALEALACIPYMAFPPKAQTLLGNILLSKAKLIAWMKFKGYDLPAFLAPPEPTQKADVFVRPDDILRKTRSSQNPPMALPPPNPAEVPVSDPSADDLRGRPRKAAWRRIRELVRELHAADPGKKRSALASDAREKARLEFDEKDLPSANTIVRQMKTIIGTEG